MLIFVSWPFDEENAIECDFFFFGSSWHILSKSVIDTNLSVKADKYQKSLI